MPSILTTAELEERSKALRADFPDLPHGDEILIEALISAATIDDHGAATLPAIESDQPE